MLDLYGSTNLLAPFWMFLSSHPATNPPAGFFRLGTHHDTDGDGLPDAYEFLVLGTSTNAVDTDLDGLPDAEELRAGTDPLDPTGENGGSGDPDGDGRTNSQERSAGFLSARVLSSQSCSSIDHVRRWKRGMPRFLGRSGLRNYP